MSGASGFVVSMPPDRVQDRKPTEELADLIGRFRPNHKMPVIQHRHHGKNRQRNNGVGFVHQLHIGLVVFRLLKKTSGEPPLD